MLLRCGLSGGESSLLRAFPELPPQTYKGQSQSDSGSVGQARALFAQTAVVSVRSALFQLRYARLLRNAIQIQAQHAYKLLPTKVVAVAK